MRLRNIPGADEAIATSPYCIQDATSHRGSWKTFLGDRPIHIEIGMGKGRFLMDLAKLIYEMKNGEVIDFAAGTEDEIENYGGWFGVKECNPFDNDNLMYLVGHYGGECNTRLYHINEYDDQIGDFCTKELERWWETTDQNYINCIGRMLADVFERFDGLVPDVITVDTEGE